MFTHNVVPHFTGIASCAQTDDTAAGVESHGLQRQFTTQNLLTNFRRSRLFLCVVFQLEQTERRVATTVQLGSVIDTHKSPHTILTSPKLK